MRKIAYLIADEYLPFLSYFKEYLTTGGDFKWKGVEYVVNPATGTFDGLVVHQSIKPLSGDFRLRVPPTKTLLVLKEPPDVCFFPGAYTSQFYAVLGQDPRVRCRRKILSHSAHHWFAEIPIDEIASGAHPEKTKLISAVVSGKQDTVGHRRRFRFMQALKEHFGENLDWWGRGVRQIPGPKTIATLPYKYQIALENGSWPHYWTEKLSDCYVSNCVPVYWGDPKVSDWFDPASMVSVDIGSPKSAIKAIEEAIERDHFGNVQEHLVQARRDIVSRYHPYEVYARTLEELPPSKPRELTIRPQSAFAYSIRDRLQLRLWKLRYS